MAGHERVAPFTSELMRVRQARVVRGRARLQYELGRGRAQTRRARTRPIWLRPDQSGSDATELKCSRARTRPTSYAVGIVRHQDRTRPILDAVGILRGRACKRPIFSGPDSYTTELDRTRSSSDVPGGQARTYAAELPRRRPSLDDAWTSSIAVKIVRG